MDDEQRFREELMAIGIIAYSEQETLLDVARRCLAIGIPMGAGWAAMSAGAGAVTVPGVGAVPGWAAGFLAGLLTGTAACTALNYAQREELKSLLR